MKHINKNFGDFEAAKDINFGVEQGRMVALLGLVEAVRQQFLE